MYRRYFKIWGELRLCDALTYKQIILVNAESFYPFIIDILQ